MTPLHRPWLLASSLISLILTWIIYREFTTDLANAGTWGCEMSWMTPSYVEIPWTASPMKRYRLFWYREQGWDKEEQPSGRPVIFVPGNAGSYSQVRSIASSASRQFYGETRGEEELPAGTAKLDFFTVDLNEEFSALHGPTLVQQAAYVSAAITHVRSLYPSPPPPVILLGHSMGGVVARLAAKSASVDSVSIILTMATPHTISPAPIDYTTESIYAGLAVHQPEAPLLVSVCGGISDTQVVSDTCALPDLSPSDGFTVFTSGLPGAWTAVDHQAMVWCHQIRWTVARALLEAGSMSSRAARLGSLRRWLTDDNTDRKVSGGGKKQVIPVTDQAMSVLVRTASTEVPRVSYCSPFDSCRMVQGKVSRIPWLVDESKPFPLVGEGVHAEDVASVVDMQLELAVGHLEVEGSEVLAHGVTETATVDGLKWTSTSKLAPMRLVLRLPIKAATLLSYKLDYETPECKGHSPVIAVRYTCGHLAESQVFAGNKRTGYQSNHIVSPPFISQRCIPETTLEITQDKACPVARISASLAWGPSLAKAVMRYRMAAVTWGIGWLALVCARMCSQMPMSLISAIEITLKQSWRTILLLLGGCVFQSVLWNMPLFPRLLVGQRSLLISIPFAVVLALWTAGLTAIGITAIEAVSNASSRTSSPIPESSPKPGAAKPAPTISSPSYTLGLTQTLITLLLSLYLPHQLISLGLFVFIWRAVPRSDGTHRAAITRTGAYLRTFSLPFNAVILPVWGRYIWADCKHPFPSEHNTLSVMPTLVFLLAVQYGRSTDKSLASRGRYIAWTLWALAAVTFGMGARYPFVVRAAVEIVLVILGIDLCI